MKTQIFKRFKKLSSVGIKCLKSKHIKIQELEFKSHTIGELLIGTVLRGQDGEVIQVLKVTRNEGRETLTSWEHEHASHDLCKKINNLIN